MSNTVTVNNTYNISLDLKREVFNSPITLTEGDTGVVFNVEIVDNGVFVDLTGTRVLAVFAKPNGLFSQDTTVLGSGASIVDGKLRLEIKVSSMSQGLNTCTLQVYSGVNYQTIVTTTSFNYRVRRSVINDSTIQEDTSLPILQQLIAQVTTAMSQALPYTNVSANASLSESGPTASVTHDSSSATFSFGIPSGVYVGDTEPTEDCIKVWIDPEGGSADTLMTESEYVGNSATGSVHNADNLGNHIPSYYATAQGLTDESTARSSADSAEAIARSAITEIKATNVTSTTYEANTHSSDTDGEFPRRFELSVPNVTSSMVANVVFGVADVLSGEVSPITECGADKVYVWTASNRDTITALSILVHK